MPCNSVASPTPPGEVRRVPAGQGCPGPFILSHLNLFSASKSQGIALGSSSKAEKNTLLICAILNFESQWILLLKDKNFSRP